MRDDRKLSDRFKIFLKRTFYSPQKIFFAGGEWFFSGKPSPTRSDMIAFNKNHVLKVENYKHRFKRNNILQEAFILQYLKNNRGVSQMELISTGKHWTKRPYMIVERIYGKRVETEYPDLIFSLIEQQKFGVFHNDIKWDNIFFDGLIVRIIDYDQAYLQEELKNMTIKENVEFFVSKLYPNWLIDSCFRNLGCDTDDAKKVFLSYFIENDFNFETTSLYKSFKNKPYYSINLDGIKALGRNNIEDLYPILDKIEFKENEKILDCGCDTGALSFYLNQRRCSVSSCDIERNAILITKMLSNIYHVNFSVLNYTNLSEKFDTVFLLNEDFIEKIGYNEIQKIIKNSKRAYIKLRNDDIPRYQKGEEIFEFPNGEKILLLNN